MNGIEKIIDRISGDAQKEIEQIQAQAQAQVEEVQAQFQAQADRERENILAQGRRQAQERQERLESAAHVEGRKLELAAKQEVVSEAFALALDKLCSLPEEDYVALLVRLAVEATSTGKEQLIFSPQDRSRIGKQVVVAANEALVKQVVPELPASLTHSRAGALLEKMVNSAAAAITGVGLLTLSQETRPIRGGFILSDGRIEVNCAFETLVRLQRETLEREVAGLLFPEHGA